MSNLTRWESGREMMTLREAMDRLFDDAFTRPLSLTREGGQMGSSPAIDLYQTDSEVVVKADLPGINADDAQISLTGDVLTIQGETRQEEEQKDKSWHIHEQSWGVFERSVRLPSALTSDQAIAEFENGILTITLPKAAKAKPKAITITSKKA
jgi:HSP20 family protein